MPLLSRSLLLAALLLFVARAPADDTASPLAVIALFNPTACADATVVEVPTGRIAAPGLLDWAQVHLETNGHMIPFALREGRAHWKATLNLPVSIPRPEDLLVFSVTVPPDSWLRVEVRPGPQPPGNALRQTDDLIEVTYPGVRIEIDPKTGSLLNYTVHDSPVLTSPFTMAAVMIGSTNPAEYTYSLKGSIATGYSEAVVEIQEQGQRFPFYVSRVCTSSTPAMSEITLECDTPLGLKMALTYRLHANGMLEVLADELPWPGSNPWLKHAVRYALFFSSVPYKLPELENRLPFYGFRDYAAAVKSVAHFYRRGTISLLELGQEIINGRQFQRRLIPLPGEDTAKTIAAAQLADEGLVVEVLPMHTEPVAGSIHIEGQGGPAADLLRKCFENSTASGPPTKVILDLFAPCTGSRTLLEGDGFAITSPSSGSVLIQSGSTLGLYNAAQAVTRHVQRHGPDAGIPLVARNPVVDFRAGGFGGGDFEVDFPYAPDEEWQRVFEGMLDSGMNIFGCLGMWSNWKMPVEFKYLPELQSQDPAAFDEATGAKLAEVPAQREHGLKLLRYLQERGARVWLWLPIGCVPTTFPKAFPQAMAQGSDKVPCPTHPDYQRYLDAFLRELLETYPIDGLVMIRDDNGGICTCERCTTYEQSAPTTNRVWQQFRDIHDRLRTLGFKGGIGAYPYNDPYQPFLEPALPGDLVIMGHGAGLGVLTRQFDQVAPMGDTWLDNLYANFRLPPSPRMRRLLADRPSFWIGGAYIGTELPWESPGYFGWEPTATPNSLRYDWGFRTFGDAGALPFLRMNNDYEALWDINALYMTPGDWIRASAEVRTRAGSSANIHLKHFRENLQALQAAMPDLPRTEWFAHLDLFAPFLEYHLERLQNFQAMYDLALLQRKRILEGKALPQESVREVVFGHYRNIYGAAGRYAAAMQQAPPGMLEHCRWMVAPYKEWMAGYDEWLDPLLEIRQFAGKATLSTTALAPGQPFELKIELHNEGVCPWMQGVGHRIELGGDAATLGLPATWDFTGEPVAPGDRRLITLKGALPPESGTAQIELKMTTPFRTNSPFLDATLVLQW